MTRSDWAILGLWLCQVGFVFWMFAQQRLNNAFVEWVKQHTEDAADLFEAKLAGEEIEISGTIPLADVKKMLEDTDGL